MSADNEPPRTRDRVRNLLAWGSKASVPATPPDHSSTLPQTSTSSTSLASKQQSISPEGQKLLEAALLELPAHKQAIIRKHLVPGPNTLSNAIDDAYNAAIDQKAYWESHRTKFSFRGHDIVLSEEADRLLQLLQRFQSAGDIVANIDPIHVGLPWIGVRLMLQTMLSDREQTAALLTGMNLVMYISNRLKVYFDHHRFLPPTSARLTLEKALMRMCGIVLEFLASALEIYEQSRTTRIWRAFWNSSQLNLFEQSCRDWAIQTDIDANNCERELNQHDRIDGTKWRDELKAKLAELDQLQGIEASLRSLHIKVDLDRLVIAKSVTYDSYSERNSAFCLPGTRTDLIGEIGGWCSDSKAPCIFWLSGMAGTGKSTIARTVAANLDAANQLGASFFFKRGEGDRGNASRFFATVARQLADKIPAVGPHMSAALESDAFLCERNPKTQLEKLIIDPLRLVSRTQPLTTTTYVVVDALDECDHSADIQTLVSLFAIAGSDTSFGLHFFITSRPELPVDLGFKQIDEIIHKDISLEKHQVDTIANDLQLFFEHEFDSIRTQRSRRRMQSSLSPNWPGDESIQALVKLADPLFIFAATICRFVSESNPQRRLQSILDQQQIMSHSALHMTYLPVLRSLLVDRDENEHESIITLFRELVGAIILLADALSPLSLSTLLSIDLEDIVEMLDHLYSVLQVSSDERTPIRLLHLSFRDFLVDPTARELSPFWIDERSMHMNLAERCLELLRATLKEDVCQLGEPGMERIAVSESRVAYHLTAEVAYACSYWVFHLQNSRVQINDQHFVHDFLKEYFLAWIEALAWLNKLKTAATHVQTLSSILSSKCSTDIASFLTDASRFVTCNYQVINLAPLQLYSSALLFAPAESIIRQKFESRNCANCWHLDSPIAPLKWSTDFQHLEGHKRRITAIVFSPDQQTVASASIDKTVRLWDLTTGDEKLCILHANDVLTVAFSDDGREIWTVPSYGTFQSYSAKTGAKITLHPVDTGKADCAAFTNDAKLVALGDKNGQIVIWDTKTTRMVSKIWEMHKLDIRHMRFSPNGKNLASASSKAHVYVFNSNNGERSWKTSLEAAARIEYSPNGQHLACALGTTIQLLDASNGDLVQVLPISPIYALEIAFSSNGVSFAMASSFGDLKVMTIDKREVLLNAAGQGVPFNSVTWSKDGWTIATGDEVGLIKLWSAPRPNELTPCGLKEVESSEELINTLVFSSDMKSLATGAADGNLCTWDTSTWKRANQRTIECWWSEPSVKLIAYSFDDREIVACSDHSVFLWDIHGYSSGPRTEVHDTEITSVTFSPTGRLLATAERENLIRIWSKADGTEVQRFQPDRLYYNECHKLKIMFAYDIFFSDDEKILLAGDMYQRMIFFDLERKTEISISRQQGDEGEVTITRPNRLPGSSLDSKPGLRLLNFRYNLSGQELCKVATCDPSLYDSLSSQGHCFSTDLGDFQLRADQLTSTKHSIVDFDDPWISIDGRNLLWLPHDYRGNSTRAYENLLVIGTNSGGLFVFVADRELPRYTVLNTSFRERR